MATTISLLMGLFSLVSGVILWYRGAVKKSYAAERDFNHLRNNQEQMKSLVVQLIDDIENSAQSRSRLQEQATKMENNLQSTRESLIEIRTHIAAISNRIEGIYARLDGERSSGWMNRKGE